jgi:hypothetical protein
MRRGKPVFRKDEAQTISWNTHGAVFAEVKVSINLRTASINAGLVQQIEPRALVDGYWAIILSS